MRGCLIVVVLLVALPARADVELPSVMDHRWSVSVDLGVGALRAQASDTETRLVMAYDLALRFRIDPEIEVGLMLGGAAIGPTSEFTGYGAVLGEIRYRFFANRPWNSFVGLGAGIAGFGDGSHLAARASVGVERRFDQAAISVSGRMTGVFSDDPESTAGGDNYELERSGAWDASAVLGFHYYWGRGRTPRVRVDPERPRR